jgi:hypothetical protein
MMAAPAQKPLHLLPQTGISATPADTFFTAYWATKQRVHTRCSLTVKALSIVLVGPPRVFAPSPAPGPTLVGSIQDPTPSPWSPRISGASGLAPVTVTTPTARVPACAPTHRGQRQHPTSTLNRHREVLRSPMCFPGLASYSSCCIPHTLCRGPWLPTSTLSDASDRTSNKSLN